MSRSQLRKQSGSHGFTMLEMVFALAILVIGITAMAALTFATLSRGRQSKYMNVAGVLASEKLEDLNRWHAGVNAGTDNSDPQICVPGAATSEGSLTVDTMTSIACASTTEEVYYYDNVNIDVTDASLDCNSGSSGCFAETTEYMVSGVTNYSTTYHSPNGSIGPVQSTTPPSNMTFHRRWLIEANTPQVGMRRVTVAVALQDKSVSPGVVNFQMSEVRP